MFRNSAITHAQKQNVLRTYESNIETRTRDGVWHGSPRTALLINLIRWVEGNYDPEDGTQTFYRFCNESEARDVARRGKVETRVVKYLGGGSVAQAQQSTAALANGIVLPNVQAVFAQHHAKYNIEKKADSRDISLDGHQDELVDMVALMNAEVPEHIKASALTVSRRLAKELDGGYKGKAFTTPATLWNDEIQDIWNDAPLRDPNPLSLLQDSLCFTTDPAFGESYTGYSHLITLKTTDNPLAIFMDVLNAEPPIEVYDTEFEWRLFGMVESGPTQQITVSEVQRDSVHP